MVVRLRLQRFGVRNNPFYRIVAADARSPRDGKFLERLGTYNPRPSKDGIKEITADSDRVKYWLSVGAQPSDRVGWLLGKAGLIPPPPTRAGTKFLIPKSLQKQDAAGAKK
jgi:small subunit ribosomal protein S16